MEGKKSKVVIDTGGQAAGGRMRVNREREREGKSMGLTPPGLTNNCNCPGALLLYGMCVYVCMHSYILAT